MEGGPAIISADTRGVFAIAPIPFLPGGALDVGSLSRMTERYATCGVDGLKILGIMDEAQKLEPEESLTVVREVIAHVGGDPPGGRGEPSCVMLKHEDWPGLEISAIRRWQDRDAMRAPSILCGNGALFLNLEMGRGADGAMTGYAFPEMLRRVMGLAPRDRDAAQDIFDAHLPLLRYEHQPGVGLAVRKRILVRRGFIAHADLRAPGAPCSDAACADIDYLLKHLAARDPICGL